MANQGSFVDVFKQTAAAHQEKPVYTFLGDKGNELQSYTYSELEQVTASLARKMLGDWDLKKGEMVMLVYPPGLDFIVSFIACFRAGVVAVPVYPPHPSKQKDINMFVSVQSSCKAKVVLTNSEYSYAKKLALVTNVFKRKSPSKEWPEMKWLVTDKVKNSKIQPENITIDIAAPKDLAFLQYTSGSTSAPKGVMLSHENLGNNLTAIIAALNASDDTVVVGWLPQYHDMGLIGSYLGVAYCGGSGFYMSPLSFIKSPPMWIHSISKYRATHLQAPNFAYKLTVRKWNEMIEKQKQNKAFGVKASDVDLKKVRHIFNAAEPVDPAAIDLFNETFSVYGLSPDAMSPGYGLAENSVYVCDGGRGRVSVDKELLEGEDRVVLVDPHSEKNSVSVLAGCGNPHRLAENGIRVRIVNRETAEPVDSDIVGEIWVSSPSKSEGYYGLEEKSISDLHAKLKTDDADLATLEWLRTGDLGFFHEEELYICGRIKDLVIIRGRNHFPQDIESSVENSDYDKLRPGCSACFTIPHPVSREEVLVVVAEVRQKKMDYTEVVTNIRKAIFSDHALVPFSIVLIEQGSINKTTSGKIKRHAVSVSFKNKALKEKHRWESSKMTSDDALAEASSETSGERAILDKKTASVDKRANDGVPSGEDLLMELKEEVARLILTDTSQVKESMLLPELGMDSLSIAQLKSIIESNYGVDIDESILFAEGTTLSTLQKVIEHGPESVSSELKGTQSHPGTRIKDAVQSKPKKKRFICC